MEKRTLKLIFNKHYTDLENIEVVIQKLRDEGASQMECTRTLISELKMSLPEADEIVVNSLAWKDTKDNIKKLRDDAFSAAEELYQPPTSPSGK